MPSRISEAAPDAGNLRSTRTLERTRVERTRPAVDQTVQYPIGDVRSDTDESAPRYVNVCLL